MTNSTVLTASDNASSTQQHEDEHEKPSVHNNTPRKFNRRWNWVLGAAIPVVLLASWHVVTTYGIVPAYQLSTPASVWDALLDLHSRGELFGHIAISTQRVILGFVLGAALGDRKSTRLNSSHVAI